MGADRARARVARAFGVAFLGVVGISSIRCFDDQISEVNIGEKLAQAVCDAEDDCCGSQGYPLTADDRLVCEGTAGAELSHPAGWVFNHDIAIACLKAARGYKCRGRSDISSVCRTVYSDPARPATVPALGPEGAYCLVAADCAFYDGLSCFRSTPTTGPGVCRKWASTGGACQFNDDCASGNYCDYGTMTCAPVRPDGAACTGTGECKSAWCVDGACMPRMGCVLY